MGGLPLRPLKFLAAMSPMSKRKKASMPLNKSIENGAINLCPESPLRSATAMDPSNRSCAPSVNDSCSILEIPAGSCFNAASEEIEALALFARTIARMIA